MDIKKNEVKDEVAKNFTFYRKKNNLTQKDLAVKLGVKSNTISQWENGINSIDIEILFRVCQILKVSIKDMYGKYYIDHDIKYNHEEKKLIESYRSINKNGHSKVLDYIDDLICSGKYIEAKTFKIAGRDGTNTISLTPQQIQELTKLVNESDDDEDNSDLV